MSKSRGRGGFSFSEGDWTCPGCSNVNFARRTECNRCGELKQSGVKKIKKGGVQIGKAAAEKSHGLFSADDWICTTCGNVNWARRSDCNLCNTPKVGVQEERTGFGGGFNERGTVEYVKREDSDDEFDQYGRRKKKKNENGTTHKPETASRSSMSLSGTAKVEEDENDDEEDSEDEDLSKYNLDEDDDDDEEGDVSKYDLSASDEDRRSRSRSRSRSSSRSSSHKSRRKRRYSSDSSSGHRRSSRKKYRSRSRSSSSGR